MWTENQRAAWRERRLEQLRAMSNADLLRTTLEAQEPDDYDSYFTLDGEWLRNVTRRLLMIRLWDWLEAENGAEATESEERDFIVGHSIVAVRPMSPTELLFEGWDREEPVLALVLSNLTLIYPTRDAEGSYPGVLYERSPHGLGLPIE